MTPARTRNPLVDDDKYYPDPTDRSSRQGRPVSRVVCHTTGGGVVQKAINALWDGKVTAERLADPEQCELITKYAVNYYRKGNGVSTTYVLGWWGDMWQTLDEDVRAWSAGMSSTHISAYNRGFRYWNNYESILVGKKRKLIQARTMGLYQWWAEEYKAITGEMPRDNASPLEFFAGDPNPDLAGISIDFLAPPTMTRNSDQRRVLGPQRSDWKLWSGADLYTRYQYSAFNLLCRELCSEYPHMQMDRRHVLTHSVTDPLSRVQFQPNGFETVGYGYDPGETWNLRWDWMLSPTLVLGEYL